MCSTFQSSTYNKGTPISSIRRAVLLFLNLKSKTIKIQTIEKPILNQVEDQNVKASLRFSSQLLKINKFIYYIRIPKCPSFFGCYLGVFVVPEIIFRA